MFIKNVLTIILNNLLIEADVVSVLPGIRADAMSPILYCIWQNSSFIPERGVFCVSSKSKKNLYERSTKNSRQQKITSGKVIVKRQLKLFNKLIISEILEYVKGKFADSFFKPKSRNFTLQDLELIQKLWIKNDKDYPKSWAEFYQITGTNKNTFNN